MAKPEGPQAPPFSEGAPDTGPQVPPAPLAHHALQGLQALQ